MYPASGADPSGYAPTVLGHEGAGVVDTVGEAVQNVAPGDHVVLHTLAFCGNCKWCNTGRPAYCRKSIANASQPFTVGGDAAWNFAATSCLSEYTVVQGNQCVKIDPRARPEAAGLIGCGVMAGFGAAVNTGGVTRGDTVAVIGCGGVGDAAIAAAALAGARTVIAVDVDDRKLEWAKGFGATHTVNSTQTDPVEAIKELTDGNGADVVVEAVGRPETYRQAFFARDLAGTLVQVGVPNPTMTIELPMIELFGRGGALKSSWYGDCLPTRDFPMLIDLYLSGKLNLDGFVSETIGIDDVEEAFHKMERGEVLRSVVVL